MSRGALILSARINGVGDILMNEGWETQVPHLAHIIQAQFCLCISGTNFMSPRECANERAGLGSGINLDDQKVYYSQSVSIGFLSDYYNAAILTRQSHIV